MIIKIFLSEANNKSLEYINNNKKPSDDNFNLYISILPTNDILNLKD